MDQIFTAITTAANALAKMVNATHVFVISDMPCNEVPFDVPTTFITTSTLANGVNDELRDFLREGGTRTFNASIVAPVLNDFSLVKDVAAAVATSFTREKSFNTGATMLALKVRVPPSRKKSRNSSLTPLASVEVVIKVVGTSNGTSLQGMSEITKTCVALTIFAKALAAVVIAVKI